MKNITILTIILVFTSCDPFIFLDKEYSIFLKNKSKNEIYYNISFNYPDTLLPDNRNHVYKIKSDEKKHVVISSTKWESSFSEHFKSDTMLIFYFDKDTLEKYDWYEIKERNLIIRKNMYSKEDLEKTDWKIYYP